MMKSLLTYSLPLIAISSLASAAPIVSESFDTPPYTAGSDLDGQNGWNGGTGYVADAVKVNATGLTHANVLGASGGSINGLAVFGDNGGQGRLLGSTVGTDSNLGESTQIWFSALFSLVGNVGASDEGNFVSIGFAAGSADGMRFGLISQGDGGAGVSAGYSFMSGIQAGNPGGAGYVTADGYVGDPFVYVGGETILVVGRMTVQDATASGATPAGQEIFDFWINPTDTTSSTSIANTAAAIMHRDDYSVLNGNWGAVTVGTEMVGSGIDGSYQDEIRVGTSLSDLGLATIPEPTTAGILLGGLALAATLVRRRRV